MQQAGKISHKGTTSRGLLITSPQVLCLVFGSQFRSPCFSDWHIYICPSAFAPTRAWTHDDIRYIYNPSSLESQTENSMKRCIWARILFKGRNYSWERPQYKRSKKNVGKRSGSVASKKKKKIRGKKRKRRAKKSKESSSPKERREVLEGSSDPKCLTMDGPCDCEIYGLKKN